MSYKRAYTGVCKAEKNRKSTTLSAIERYQILDTCIKKKKKKKKSCGNFASNNSTYISDFLQKLFFPQKNQ